MAFRVYLQKRRYESFIDSGVIEVNEAQRDNWRDICQHCGYYAFRFIPVECNYRLKVAKRCFRKRCKKATKESK